MKLAPIHGLKACPALRGAFDGRGKKELYRQSGRRILENFFTRLQPAGAGRPMCARIGRHTQPAMAK